MFLIQVQTASLTYRAQNNKLNVKKKLNKKLNMLPVAKPPWTKLGRKLESMLRKAIFEYDLLSQVSNLGVALSGGKDSLTLLYLLSAIRGKGFQNFKITAIHVTGDFSCGASISQKMLNSICHELDVELKIIEQKKSSGKISCYPCSRERRRLLFNCAKESNIDTIAFGHHRDDSIQTLLMNLLHKGEFAANLAKVYMQHYQMTLIRPLIYISEDEIIRFAQAQGFNRIVCKCPIGQNSMRKKTDHILNYLEKTFPEARSNLALASRIYGSDKANRP